MKGEISRERIQKLLVTGDNRLKQGVDPEKARESWLQATKHIRQQLPSARVLMLTGSNSKIDVDRAREAGAAGYVTKERIAAELIDAILEIARH